MALAEDNLEVIRSRIIEAYKKEEPVLEKLREQARRLKNHIKPIRPYPVNSVSFVASDGGDNRLFFNPAVIELVRIVDSRGNQCVIDAISGNSTPADFNKRGLVDSPFLVKPLQKLCEDINKSVLELSYFLLGINKPGKSTGAVRAYRDIVEWAVLYDLMRYRDWGTDTILVREGLLRSKSFRGDVFPLIDRKLRESFRKHKQENVTVSLVGVAKQSSVLSRLAVALELEGTFHKNYPCYVKVPVDIESECYNFDRAWFDTYGTAKEREDGQQLYQSMGRLHLVKFGNRPFDPIWPVDIAEWQVDEADKILGQLTNDAQLGFPVPDFPMSVQKAHDFAKINGLEISILQDILFEGITGKMTAAEIERILRMKHLGQSLTNLRYKNA